MIYLKNLKIFFTLENIDLSISNSTFFKFTKKLFWRNLQKISEEIRTGQTTY